MIFDVQGIKLSSFDILDHIHGLSVIHVIFCIGIGETRVVGTVLGSMCHTGEKHGQGSSKFHRSNNKVLNDERYICKRDLGVDFQGSQQLFGLS